MHNNHEKNQYSHDREQADQPFPPWDPSEYDAYIEGAIEQYNNVFKKSIQSYEDDTGIINEFSDIPTQALRSQYLSVADNHKDSVYGRIHVGAKSFEHIITDQARQSTEKLPHELVQHILDARSTQNTHSKRQYESFIDSLSEDERIGVNYLSDYITLIEVKETASLYGVDNAMTRRRLDGASSLYVKEALKTSLDPMLLEDLLRTASLYGVDNAMTRRRLDGASSPNVKNIFSKIARKEKSPYDRNSRRSPEEPIWDSAFDDIYNSAIPPNHRAARPSQPNRSANKPPVDKTKEAREFLKSSHNYPSHVKTASPAEMQRLINSVKAIREKLEKDGVVDPSKQNERIWRKYRSAVDKPDASENVKSSYAILWSVMGESHKGSIPF